MDLNQNTTFSAVTTFNLKKHPYGIDMINSFFVNWPDEIKLTAFVENSSMMDDTAVKHKIFIKEYHQHIPEYRRFCEKFKEKGKLTDDFRYNVFTFAHKVYAIFQALKSNKSKYLIWLDADIKTYKKLPISFLETLVSNEHYLSYLGREHISIKHLRFSECGFLIFNTEHALHSEFWKQMMIMYDDGKLFLENEWHDSYIFDVVRKNLEKTKNISNINISDFGLVNLKDSEHVFVLSVLGGFMDHKKGNRKSQKWSSELLARIKKDIT